MSCKSAFSQVCTRETVVSKTENAKASEAKTGFSCTTEEHESTKQRIESVTKRNHEEHMTGKGRNSVLHYNLVHKFIPMPQAIRFQMQRQQWTRKKLETIPAWDVRKVKSKKEVVKEAQKNNNKFHFTSLMDFWRTRSWSHKSRSYKGRVVLRGDIVKDDSGAYAAFTEQGSSASQITDWKFKNQNVRMYWYVYHNTNGPNRWQTLKILLFLLNETCTDTHSQDSCGKDSSHKTLMELAWEKVPNWECLLVHRKHHYSYRFMWMTSTWPERSRIYLLCGRNWFQHHFLITFT